MGAPQAQIDEYHSGGVVMPRIWLCLGLLVASTVNAYAGVTGVPEIDAASGLAAVSVIGSIAALLWERKRRSRG